jgi:hypothetical protein
VNEYFAGVREGYSSSCISCGSAVGALGALVSILKKCLRMVPRQQTATTSKALAKEELHNRSTAHPTKMAIRHPYRTRNFVVKANLGS